MFQKRRKKSSPKVAAPRVVPAVGNIPKVARQGDAGHDLKANLSEPVVIQPGGTQLIPTGLRMAIPEGMVGLVCSRSGLALKNQVFVLNAPGVIDSNYRGEVGVILHNTGSDPFTVTPGSRIAQLLLINLPQVALHPVEGLPETNRGGEGFGSSGI